MSDTTTATKPRKKPGPKAGAKRKGDKPARKAGRAATPAGPPPAAPEEVAIPLTAIDLSIARGVRAGVDDEAVERYRQRYAAKEPMPPLEGAAVKGKPDTPVYVGDGGHRGRAAMDAGLTSVPVIVHWCETEADAQAKAWEIAYAGNTTHGLPRTSEDLRAAIRSALLREPADTSDRKLAAKLHCHRTPVVKVRYEMTEAGELEGMARFDARDYKESEYAAWKLGKAERPKAKPQPADPAPEPPAARPPEPNAGWRGVSVLDADLGTACERELAALGVTTVGGLADLLADPLGMGKVLEAHRTDLQEVVDELKADGLVTADTPVPPPVDMAPVATPTDPTPAPGAVVRDEKGRPVPEHLTPVFQARSQFRSLSQRIGAFLSEVKALAGSPGGAAVQLQAAEQDANSLSRGVAGGMPYVVCPACSGDGTAKGKACPHCVGVSGEAVGRGWVCRLRYDQFEPGEKRKAEGPWDATPASE